MTEQPAGQVRRAERPGDYAASGVEPGLIAPWEDGPRAGAEGESFEWWYADFVLEDGAALVVFFFTKPFAHPTPGLLPVVSVTLRLPRGAGDRGGPQVFPALAFSAADQTCDVRIEPGHRFAGDLANYVIEAEAGGVGVSIRLQAETPPARIGTGELLFERAGTTRRFGWLVGVPSGRAEVSYRVDGRTVQTRGIGYHDHNWGDAEMSRLMHHWHWGRARVGDYVVIVVQVVPQPEYGAVARTDMILFERGRQRICGSAHLRFEASAPVVDPQSGVPVCERLAWHYDDGSLRCDCIFERRTTLLRRPIDGDPEAGDPEAVAAYLRFAGVCSLRVVDEGGAHEAAPVPASWELMWFGHEVPHGSATAYAQAALAHPPATHVEGG